MNIRKARFDDSIGIKALIDLLYPDGYPKVWYNQGIQGIEQNLDNFWVAEKSRHIQGCVALNKEYWPEIPVAYIESLMVDPKHQGAGVGCDLIRKAIEGSNSALISLDRKTSIRMMLRLGFEPVAFLPNREYFGQNLESLFLTAHRNNPDTNRCCTDLNYDDHIIPGIKRVRKKEINEKKYFMEIIGTNLDNKEVRQTIDKKYSCIQIINHRVQKPGLSLPISGNLKLHDSEVDVHLISKSKIRDLKLFYQACKDYGNALEILGKWNNGKK